MTTHVVASTADTVRSGYLDPAAKPVASVGRVWAAEGPATLHLTLNPVVEALDDDSPATARSVLMIVDPAPPVTIRTVAAITQTLIRQNASWYISSRTVADPRGSA